MTTERTLAGPRRGLLVAIVLGQILLAGVGAWADPPPGFPKRLTGSLKVKRALRPAEVQTLFFQRTYSTTITFSNIEMEWVDWPGSYRVTGGEWEYEHQEELRSGWEGCPRYTRVSASGSGKMPTEGEYRGRLKVQRDEVQAPFGLSLWGEEVSGKKTDESCTGPRPEEAAKLRPEFGGGWDGRRTRVVDGMVTFDLNDRSPTEESRPGWETWETTGQLVGKTDPYDIRVTRIRWISDHHLAVYTRRNFGDRSGQVTLQATINGRTIPKRSVERFTNLRDAEDAYPIVLDLKEANVPKFQANQTFTLRVSAELKDGKRLEAHSDVAFLLPVVFVAGTLNGTPEPGHFDDLERFLFERSEGGYRPTEGGDGPPNLWTVLHPTTEYTLAEGALRLRDTIRQVLRASWADKVSVVTQSKGGVVARAYLAYHPEGKESVSRLIMCSPPNLGSLYGRIPGFDGPWPGPDMAPVWPWARASPTEPYRADPDNPALRNLNDRPLPEGIQYTIIYSHSPSWPTQTAVERSPKWRVTLLTDGDGVVPWFSAIGVMVDPNDGMRQEVIRAFKHALDHHYLKLAPVTAFHVRYNEDERVMPTIYDRLTEPAP